MNELVQPTPLLRLSEVCYRYRPEQPRVLEKISLNLYPGDRLAIVGPNGTGKTTLLRLLLGLHRPEHGKVEVLGQSVAWDRYSVAVGYLGDPASRDGELGLPGEYQVGQLLDCYHGLFAASGVPLPLAAELGSGLGLHTPWMRNRWIGQLSSGERRKVMAYLALAKAPALIIGDEATTGLDAHASAVVLDTVKKLADQGSALLWITHRLEEVAWLGTRVLRLLQGKLLPFAVESFTSTLTLDERKQAQQQMSPTELLHWLGTVLLQDRYQVIAFHAERTHAN